MTDYEDLRGKKIDVVYPERTYKGTIADIDYSIGITIVATENHDYYLYCIYGELGFRALYGKSHPDIEWYEKEFKRLVEEIKKGTVELERGGRTSNKASAKSCPFNQ